MSCTFMHVGAGIVIDNIRSTTGSLKQYSDINKLLSYIDAELLLPVERDIQQDGNIFLTLHLCSVIEESINCTSFDIEPWRPSLGQF